MRDLRAAQVSLAHHMLQNRTGRHWSIVLETHMLLCNEDADDLMHTRQMPALDGCMSGLSVMH